MAGALLILVQGFRTVEKQPVSISGGGVARYEFAITRWGAIHTALAIAVTVLIAIHGVLFLGGLLEFTAPIWIGAAAFIVLVMSNLSGVITESKRKSRAFGPLKTMHVLLVLTVVVLSAIHIEVMLGPSYARLVLIGTIVALVVVSVVYVTLPLTLQTGRPL